MDQHKPHTPYRIRRKKGTINKEHNGEVWVETTTYSHKLQWLAETGSPKSFINQKFAQQLQKEIPITQISDYTESTIYNNFTNNNIEIKRSTNLRHKVRTLDSKSMKVIDSDKSNKQHYRERPTCQTRHRPFRANKQSGKKINLISQFQARKT